VNQAEEADDYLDGRQVVALLVETVAKGGHLLLNVGPAADGTIPETQARVLRDAGEWVRAHADVDREAPLAQSHAAQGGVDGRQRHRARHQREPAAADGQAQRGQPAEIFVDPVLQHDQFGRGDTLELGSCDALFPLSNRVRSEQRQQQSDAGRAVFITSGAASQAPAYLGPYAASKAALDAVVRVWAAETASTSIRVNLFSPGPIRTRMRATVFPGEVKDTELTVPKSAGRQSLT